MEITWPPDTKKINRRYFNGELTEMVSHKIPGSKHYLVTVHLLEGVNGIKTIMEKKLTETIADTIHDLKTPINGIHGFTQLIIDESKRASSKDIETNYQEMASSIKSYAEIVLKNSTSMITKINNMLMLSRLEQGLNELNVTEINLLDFTQTLIERFYVRLKKENIKLSRKVTSSDYIIHADHELLERAIENMVLNAMEALGKNNSDLKKEISLHLSRDPNGNISFTVTNPGTISTENLSKMFKSRFTTKKNGNGIGLKTIRLVAESHGGKPSVKCENELVYVTISFPDTKV